MVPQDSCVVNKQPLSNTTLGTLGGHRDEYLASEGRGVQPGKWVLTQQHRVAPTPPPKKKTVGSVLLLVLLHFLGRLQSPLGRW